MMPRLRCCKPTRYDGKSRTLVHAYMCAAGRSGKVLTDMEMSELVHPAGKNVLPFVPHTACKIADADGLRPCSRCAPLLHVDGCKCDPCLYAVHHSDDEDDERVPEGAR